MDIFPNITGGRRETGWELAYLRIGCGVSSSLLLISFLNIGILLFIGKMKSPNLSVRLAGCLATVDICILILDQSLSVLALQAGTSSPPGVYIDVLLALRIIHNIGCNLSTFLLIAMCSERIFWMITTTATRGTLSPSSGAGIGCLIAFILALFNLPGWIISAQGNHSVSLPFSNCPAMTASGIFDLVVSLGCLGAYILTLITLIRFNRHVPFPRSIHIQSEIKVCSSVLYVTALNMIPVVVFLSSFSFWSKSPQWPIGCISIDLARRSFSLSSAVRPVVLLLRSKNLRKCLASLIARETMVEDIFITIQPTNKIGAVGGFCPRGSGNVCSSSVSKVFHCSSEGPVNRISVISFSGPTFTDAENTFMNDNMTVFSCQNGDCESQLEFNVFTVNGSTDGSNSLGGNDRRYSGGCRPIANSTTISQSCHFCDRPFDVRVNGIVGRSSLTSSNSHDSLKEPLQTLNIQMKAQRKHGIAACRPQFKLPLVPLTPTKKNASQTFKRRRAFSDSTVNLNCYSDRASPLSSPSPQTVIVQASTGTTHEKKVFRLPSVTVSLVEPVWMHQQIGQNDVRVNFNMTSDIEYSQGDIERKLSIITERTQSTHSSIADDVSNTSNTISLVNTRLASNSCTNRSKSLPVIRINSDCENRSVSEMSYSGSFAYEPVFGDVNSSNRCSKPAPCESPTLPGAIVTPPCTKDSAFTFDLRHVCIPSPPTNIDIPAFPGKGGTDLDLTNIPSSGVVISYKHPASANVKSMGNSCDTDVQKRSRPEHVNDSSGSMSTKKVKRRSMDLHQESSGVYIGTIGI